MLAQDNTTILFSYYMHVYNANKINALSTSLHREKNIFIVNIFIYLIEASLRRYIGGDSIPVITIISINYYD